MTAIEHSMWTVPPAWPVEARAEFAPGAVRLWYARTDGRSDAPSVREALDLLDEVDRARYARLRREDDRRQLLVSRALTRAALSSCDDVEPEAWRFSADSFGKPEVAWPHTDLRFNISHTVGLVVCAVARGRSVGVDAERVGAGHPILEMARLCLAPCERDALMTLPYPVRDRRFLELWTLKESYLKARGVGLSMSPADFAMDPDAHPIRFASRPPDDPSGSWAFHRFRPTSEHVVALCVESAEGAHQFPLQ